MLSYKNFTEYFGSYLTDTKFQAFLTEIFTDLTSYDILNGDYICSDKTGIELGFTNDDAIYDDDENIVFEKGNPIFSHFNLYPKSDIIIAVLPFDISFNDTRATALTKAGNPTKTNQGHADFLNRDFFVDSYKIDDVIISLDYDTNMNKINFIQLRDNNLKSDLKL